MGSHSPGRQRTKSLQFLRPGGDEEGESSRLGKSEEGKAGTGTKFRKSGEIRASPHFAPPRSVADYGGERRIARRTADEDLVLARQQFPAVLLFIEDREVFWIQPQGDGL